MNAIAIVSAKGGVGKTTLAANLASVLAASGARVVVVDLDPQNALRLHFGAPFDSIDGLSRAALSGEDWRASIFDSAHGVTVLPYGVVTEEDRRSFESMLDARPDLLSDVLASLSLDASDFVLIDTPPGASVYTRAALSAANFAVNVVLGDAASYAAIPQMERLIEAYAAPRAAFLGYGYVVNQVDQSRQLTKDVVRTLRAQLGARMFPGVVHADEGVCEALAYDTTLIHYDGHCRAAADLNACAAWLVDSLRAARTAPRARA